MSTLFERLGGEATVSQAVDLLYSKVLNDERVNRLFNNVDMERLAAKQKAFLTMAFGGPNRYLGKDMREGHKHLLALGLNNRHFDVITELLCHALKKVGAADTDILEVTAIAHSVRNEVLNR